MKMHDRNMEVLRDGVRELGLSLSEAQESQFAAYLGEIALFNSVYKLVAADGEELVVKHLLDSIAAVPVFQKILSTRQWEHPRLCDVGSGAGFPGIPLAIMLDGLRVTLVERSGRRAGFLRNALAICNLTSRVEVLEKDLSEVLDSYQLVTFRAFHPLADIIQEVSAITDHDGVVCAYKGKLETTDGELKELDRLAARGKGGSENGWNISRIPLQVPFLGAPRHLCLLEKR